LYQTQPLHTAQGRERGSEDAGPLGASHRVSQQTIKIVPVKEVAAQHQRRPVVTDEGFADNKGVRQTIG